MRLLIPVAYGLESTLKRELSRLGYPSAPCLRGRALLEGDWSDVARLNVRLRTGERVLVGVGEFPARTFEELFEGARALPWEEFLTPHAAIRMDGKCAESALMAIKATGGVVKKAILSRLAERTGAARFDESGGRAVVGVSLYRDVATLTLDCSGDGLHRRGYRVLAYEAPLRETTAAAIVFDSYYRPDRAFADPFCGSGTLAVEAALFARNIAPGGKRQFDFTRWRCVGDVLGRAREEAREEEYRGEIAPIYASDLSPAAVAIAKRHAAFAGVEKDIRFSCADVKDFAAAERGGVLVSNPPYGERMGRGDLFPLYRDFSRAYRRLQDWNCSFITACPDAERAFGRPDRRRVLYNANLRCTLYSYFPARERGR